MCLFHARGCGRGTFVSAVMWCASVLRLSVSNKDEFWQACATRATANDFSTSNSMLAVPQSFPLWQVRIAFIPL